MSLKDCPPTFKIVKLQSLDAERDSINAALQALSRCLGEHMLPDPTGHAGEYLSTDGTDVFWAPGGGGGVGQVDSIVAGDGVDVDSTDPVNPVVSALISTDGGNALSFGSDDGLYAAAGGGSAERVIEYEIALPVGVSISSGSSQSIYPGLPYGIQLTSWRIRTQDVSGSIVMDVRRVATDATPTAADSICGVGQEPYLSSEVARLETNLSGWIDTVLDPNDRVAVYVDYSTIVGLRSAILVLYGTQL